MMNIIFSLIENANSYYPLLIVILYILYYLISNSFMFLILIIIGILIGFYITYIFRHNILYYYS
jgi:multisubunit Na+/H+ antiporter MnhE subunit